MGPVSILKVTSWELAICRTLAFTLTPYRYAFPSIVTLRVYSNTPTSHPTASTATTNTSIRIATPCNPSSIPHDPPSQPPHNANLHLMPHPGAHTLHDLLQSRRPRPRQRRPPNPMPRMQEIRGQIRRARFRSPLHRPRVDQSGGVSTFAV